MLKYTIVTNKNEHVTFIYSIFDVIIREGMKI